MIMPNDAHDTSSSVESETLPEVSRRSMLEYSNASSAVDRIRRWMPPREKAIDTLKTLFWVVLLTVIIWIYAEQEQVLQTPASVSNVQVLLKTTDSKRYFAAAGSADPAVTTVTLKLTGPQEAVRRVSDELTKIGGQKPTIYLDPNRPNGNNQLINVVGSIQDEDIFRKNGVTVKESLPPELSVNIDNMGHRELTVQPPTDIPNLSPDSRFEPAKVEVSGPEKLLNNQDQLKVFASLDGLEELKRPGEHRNLSVPVTLVPPLPELSIDPPLVKATITMLKMDASTVIGPIPIEVQLPPGMVGQYDLTLTAGASVNQIHVSGPQQDIDALKNFAPKAILEVLPSDARLDTPSKPLHFVLPPNVKVRDDDAAVPVEFKLTKLIQPG